MTGLRSILFFLFFFSISFLKAQLKANAGLDQKICPNESAHIGADSASGGTPPYTYKWQPVAGLSSANIAKPDASPASSTTYTLIVTDAVMATDTAVVNVTLNPINDVSAGNDTVLCGNDRVRLGGIKNSDNKAITYSWLPTNGLSNPNSPFPVADVTGTVSYTLTATTAGCAAKTSVITITVKLPPVVDAGPNVTIKEGEVATLHATGGYIYYWDPNDSMKYANTANPDVSPSETRTYYVYSSEEGMQCFGLDSVIVFVEKSNDIIIYNTFTPNGDGSNDVWTIANIQKYPSSKLEVYNRNGKIVYKTTGYMNTWNGKSSGEELPAGTYFYVLDLGNGQEKYHGSVTIIR